LSCNFGIAHYFETIDAYHDAGYSITPVSDYFQAHISERHLLLRHDVDLSLDYALELALLEKDNDTRATYYILLHGGLYDALGDRGTETIREIKKAGHEIGLHIDTRHYLGQVEFSILSAIAQCDVTSWCQHLITITPHLSMPRDAAFIPYKYLSDSAMNWREGCFCNHINKHDKMQILVHPEWHTVSPNGQRNRWEILEALEEAAKGNLAASFRGFRDLMKLYEQTSIIHSIA
jgi:hypothetical protein